MDVLSYALLDCSLCYGISSILCIVPDNDLFYRISERLFSLDTVKHKISEQLHSNSISRASPFPTKYCMRREKLNCKWIGKILEKGQGE